MVAFHAKLASRLHPEATAEAAAPKLALFLALAWQAAPLLTNLRLRPTFPKKHKFSIGSFRSYLFYDKLTKL